MNKLDRMEESEECSRIAPKPKITSEELVKAVDSVLLQYCEIEMNLKYPQNSYANFRRKVTSTSVRCEKMVMGEIDADLWDRALVTSLGDITVHFYPHHIIVQKFINYTLNSGTVNYGTMTTFFSKLLLFHPPHLPEMQKYYWSLISDKYVMLNKKEREESNLFWCLMDWLAVCLQNKDLFADVHSTHELCNQDGVIANMSGSIKKDLPQNILPSDLQNNIMMGFNNLSTVVKLERVLLLFQFLYNIFESDYQYKINTGQLKLGRNQPFEEENRVFLSLLFWPSAYEEGSINKSVKKLITVYRHAAELKHYGAQVINKIFGLLSEVIRKTDSTIDPVYPFFGPYSNSLASELFLLNKGKEVELLKQIKPHWLRLLVCCNMLSHFTGRVCSPELMTVCDILEYVILLIRERSTVDHINIYNINEFQKTIIRGRKKLKTESKILCTFCKSGGIGRIKSNAVVYKTLNTTNESGWTFLHEAVIGNHDDCVNELLSFRPKIRNKRKSMNVRAKGNHNLTPLMCAVLCGNAKLCRLLLEHSGSELMEDVDDKGRKPMDLCKNAHVADVLKYFEQTELPFNKTSRKSRITVNEIGQIMSLCVQLVELYFFVHRTWDVYKLLKSRSSGRSKGKGNALYNNIKWDYLRYHSDIKKNINKLKSLMPKLMENKEYEILLEPLARILTFNNV